MNPVMQDAAANALREGLARFDGGRGWRDIGKSVDLSGDWAAELDRTPVGTGFPDWKKAVVLSKNSAEASDRLHQWLDRLAAASARAHAQARRRRHGLRQSPARA